MKKSKMSALVAGLAISGCALCANISPAKAASMYMGWNYAIDAVDDGSGGDEYDIRGMAIKDAGDTVFVAFSGGTPLSGVAEQGASGGAIGWGDLFFNFSGKDFQTASNEGSLFAVRFTTNNESGAVSLGVYRNVSAKSVTAENVGYDSLDNYYDSGFYRDGTQGDLATREAVNSYYGGGGNPILNVITSGEKVGEIASLNASSLASTGLNFDRFNATGQHTFGFSFSKSAFGNSFGAYIANIFLECGNDAVAIASNLEPAGSGNKQEVPEPTILIGTALAALGLKAGKLKAKKS